jgi:hypothetical protein
MKNAPRIASLIAILFTLATASSSARAEEASPAPVPPTPPAAEGPGSYRLQVAAASAATLGSLALGLSVEAKIDPLADVLMTAGFGGYFVAAPTVHLVHRNYGRAAASLGMRLVLPVVGGMVGASMATCHEGEWLCGLSELGTGMFAGGVVASALDVAFLAGGSGHPERGGERPAPTARPAVTVAPRLAAGPNLAYVGLGGQF